MVQRHYLQLAGGSTIEVTDRVENIEGWEFTEKAEEGAYGGGSVWLKDPDMDLDVDGLRSYYVLEDESEATDNVLWGGFVVDPEVSRGEQGTTHYEPLARAWQLQLTDRNGYWNRRVMVGTDCKRPAESDVTRMQWLLTTSEAAWLDDATTYLATGSPVNMDKVDYRGQYLNQIVDDCAQQSGKNWWTQLQYTGVTRKNVGWYGSDGLTDYSSPLYLSNDPADWIDSELLDGTSLVWPIGDKTRLKRGTERIYTGVYLRYANGTKAIYRRNATSYAVYGARDYVADYPNVKTKAKAVARATRLLADLANPDERITTTVRLPKGKATMLRAGMRVPFKATHEPGYTSYRWLRVLSCAIKPVGIGDQYDLSLELQGPGSAAVFGFCVLDHSIAITPSATYPPINGTTTDAAGNIWYTNSNHGYFAGHVFSDGPNPAASCYGLGFSSYGSGGSTDFGGSLIQNTIAFVFAGGGTAVVHTADGTGTTAITVTLNHNEGVDVVTDETQTGVAGDTFTVTTGPLPDASTSCYRWIEVLFGGPGGGSAGFSGIDWTAS